MASTFILTSAPLLVSQVPLASFVPDHHQPYADVKAPYTVKQSEYSVRPDTNFSGLVSASSESHFKVILTKLVSFGWWKEKGSMLQMNAEVGSIYTVNSPNDLFTNIMASDQHGETMKRWLEEHRRGPTPRFVVGFRTFLDSKLGHAERVSHQVEGSVDVPTSIAQGDPSGAMDVKVGAGYKKIREGQGQATILGERIYAIAYRKIEVTIRKGAVIATLDLKTKWEPFSTMRGEGKDESVYFEANILSGEDEEDCRIFTIGSAAGEDGETTRIGVLTEDNLDEEDIDTNTDEKEEGGSGGGNQS